MAPMLDQRIEITSYTSILASASAGQHTGAGEPVSRSGSVEHITPEFAAAAARLLRSGDYGTTPPTFFATISTLSLCVPRFPPSENIHDSVPVPSKLV